MAATQEWRWIAIALQRLNNLGVQYNWLNYWKLRYKRFWMIPVLSSLVTDSMMSDLQLLELGCSRKKTLWELRQLVVIEIPAIPQMRLWGHNTHYKVDRETVPLLKVTVYSLLQCTVISINEVLLRGTAISSDQLVGALMWPKSRVCCFAIISLLICIGKWLTGGTTTSALNTLGLTSKLLLNEYNYTWGN